MKTKFRHKIFVKKAILLLGLRQVFCMEGSKSSMSGDKSGSLSWIRDDGFLSCAFCSLFGDTTTLGDDSVLIFLVPSSSSSDDKVKISKKHVKMRLKFNWDLDNIYQVPQMFLP